MFKSILLNLLFINLSLSQPSPPTPGSNLWTYLQNPNRTLRTFEFIDECGEDKSVLTPDQKVLFLATSASSLLGPGQFLDKDWFLHALLTDSGKELWNISINSGQQSSRLLVSASNDLVVFGGWNVSNGFMIQSAFINNGTLSWNKTIPGNVNDVNTLSNLRVAVPENVSDGRVVYQMESKYNSLFNILTLSNGNPIGSPKYPGPASNLFLTSDLKSIIYTTGSGTQEYVYARWLINGSSRKVMPDGGGCDWVVRIDGADDSFMVLQCGIDCHMNCPYDSRTLFINLKTRIGIGSVLNGGGGVNYESTGLKWTISAGNGTLLYKSFKGQTYTITAMNIHPIPSSPNGGIIWTIPTDSSDNSLLPAVVLVKEGLILFTSEVSDYGSTYSQLTAIWTNNGTTAWTQNFKWSITPTAYQSLSQFNAGACKSSVASVSEDTSKLVLIDNKNSGHVLSLSTGIELFNVSFDIMTHWNLPYSPTNVVSIVSGDTSKIYSVIPASPLLPKPYSNGQIIASNIGNDCDNAHFGQGCKLVCSCLNGHNDSGVFGSGRCLPGSCYIGWQGDNCDNCNSVHFGDNCSKMMCRNGMCDCGINGTGYCASCNSGFIGKNCGNCSSEFFGPECREACSCRYGTNSSGINGTGHCIRCNDPRWSGDDCNLCYGEADSPQCGSKYLPIDCLDPINGRSIRRGCQSMCNSCPPPSPAPPPCPPPSSPVPSPQQCDSPDINNARCTCNGVEYDFSQIQSSDGNSYFSGPDKNNEFMYYFQMTNGGLPTDDGLMPYCTFSAGVKTGNSVGQGEINGSSCFPIGAVSHQQWQIDTTQNPQIIWITFSGGQNGRQTVLSVTCDPSANDPTFIAGGGGREQLVYKLDMTSKYACNLPPPPSPAPPPSPPTPPATKKYVCINNKCEINYNNTGGTLEQCQKICKNIYWSCIKGYCIPNLSGGLNQSMCQYLCKH